MLMDEKIKLYGKSIQNRIVIQPMEGCDGTETGGIGELTRRRYASGYRHRHHLGVLRRGKDFYQVVMQNGGLL